MKKIFILILGIIIGTSITAYAAYKYNAGEVEYTPENENWKVDNVESALNELYTSSIRTYNIGDVIFYNPVTNKRCKATEANSATETKTGCMKWYVIKNNDDNVDVILDHNTTVRIKWNDENKNVAYEQSNLKPEVDKLVSVSGWKVTPRLITAEEVVSIVGGVSTWNVLDFNTWFYFEGTGTNKQTMPTYSEVNRSKYAWLYDNLYGCRSLRGTDYGCNIEDKKEDYMGTGTAGNGSSIHYWTSTPIGETGSGTYIWVVRTYGNLGGDYSGANSPFNGIRPVITISKSVIK